MGAQLHACTSWLKNRWREFDEIIYFWKTWKFLLRKCDKNQIRDASPGAATFSRTALTWTAFSQWRPLREMIIKYDNPERLSAILLSVSLTSVIVLRIIVLSPIKLNVILLRVNMLSISLLSLCSVLFCREWYAAEWHAVILKIIIRCVSLWWVSFFWKSFCWMSFRRVSLFWVPF